MNNSCHSHNMLGAPWRDLLGTYGDWENTHYRFCCHFVASVTFVMSKTPNHYSSLCILVVLLLGIIDN